MRKSNEIFGGFISGKLLDSAIIGILAYVVLTIMRIDVYKRQGYAACESKQPGMGGCRSPCRIRDPVSYTHLDVYKRQGADRL